MNYTTAFRQAVTENDSSNKLKLYNESIQDDLVLRKLFVSDRDNERISWDDAGLFSVYDNYDIFKVLPLSNEEKDQAVIMTKDMEVLEPGTSAICTRDEFLSNFEIFTEGLFECMDWNNMFLAGGSVLAILSDF